MSRVFRVVDKIITLTRDNVNLKLVISLEENSSPVAPKIRN